MFVSRKLKNLYNNKNKQLLSLFKCKRRYLNSETFQKKLNNFSKDLGTYFKPKPGLGRLGKPRQFDDMDKLGFYGISFLTRRRARILGGVVIGVVHLYAAMYFAGPAMYVAQKIEGFSDDINRGDRLSLDINREAYDEDKEIEKDLKRLEELSFGRQNR